MKEAYAAWSRIYQGYLVKPAENSAQLYNDIQLIENFFEEYPNGIDRIRVTKDGSTI